MGFLFGGGAKAPAPPPPPPPPPNPPTAASPTVSTQGAAARAAAAAAAGTGFDNTLLTGGQGTLNPSTAEKRLTGQSILILITAGSMLATWAGALT